MTLVVAAEDSEDFAALGETIAALMPEHPARVIVVRLRGGTEGGLAARVFAQCWMPFGQRRQICCEQIEITGPDSALEDAASVVDPVIAADLPVIVWCRSARILDAAGFGRLAGLARKVIVDSSAWPDGQEGVRRVAQLASRGVEVGDLAWTRLTRWRETLARLFENPHYLKLLPGVKQVQAGYGGANAPAAARYMGGWLRDALSRVGAQTDLQLVADAPGPAGYLLRVELNGPEFQLRLTRREDRLIVETDSLSSCTNLPQPTDYLLLREELGIVERDPVFERVRAAAARL
jgi:glucose-6-phosphate dehydrogenase assembly protein OpcA